jgi:hypothetical protein
MELATCGTGLSVLSQYFIELETELAPEWHCQCALDVPLVQETLANSLLLSLLLLSVERKSVK